MSMLKMYFFLFSLFQNDGDTALHFAIAYQYDDVADVLILNEAK